jgi:uncharacterized membrane protein YkvA (DUF1232 family)
VWPRQEHCRWQVAAPDTDPRKGRVTGSAVGRLNSNFRPPERAEMTYPMATTVTRCGPLSEIWSRCGKAISATFRDVRCLCLILKHPDTPWHVRIILSFPVAYVFSPIQLFPNFIPVFGQLDDLFMIWIANQLVLRLVSQQIRRECREAVG